MKTSSEIYADQGTSKETLTLLKQLRSDYYSLILDKVLIISKVWNGEGERPYTLSISEEENMNKALELEEVTLKIAHNLSNYVTEIARMQGVSQTEAEKILAENIKINKAVFEATQEMMQADQGSGSFKGLIGTGNHLALP
jgi:hypothetical protein